MVQPSAALVIGGGTYRLVFDFDALAEGSIIIDRDLLSTHPATAFSTLTASQLRGLLVAALVNSLTPTEAGRLICLDRTGLICRAISEAWILSMPPRKKDDKNGKGSKLTSAQVWEKCYVSARIRLGLTDKEFGELTPRRLRLLLDEYGEQREELKLLFGVVSATVANFSDGRPETPLRPSDFFAAKPKYEKPKRINRQAVANKIRMFVKAHIEHHQIQ